jgi:truncated hemoglobin YjbI
MLVLAAPASGSSQGPPAQSPTLYQRLGGKKVLAAFTQDGLEHAAQDPRLARLFKGQDRKHQQESVLNFLCALSHGPCSYDPVAFERVCAKLLINDQEWKLLVDQLTQAMARHKISKKETDDLILQIENLRPSIIQS